MGRDEFSGFLANESKRWRSVIEVAGIKASE
jgi:hypothetical protein